MPAPQAMHDDAGNQLLLPSSPSRRTPSLTTRLTKLLSFFMIGTISWVGVTALFAQASAFQLVVPEHQKIFSYIDTFMESGNVVPAFLFIFMSSEQQLRAYNTRMTYAVAVGALITMALLSFCWSLHIGGTSFFILLGAWAAGAVGSTSMLVMFNFAGKYGRDAVSALSVGIGACGLVTNILGIVQGLPKLKDSSTSTSTKNSTQSTPSSSTSSASLDGKLLFGPTTFFLVVGVWIAVGCIFLKIVTSCKDWQIVEKNDDEEGSDSSGSDARDKYVRVPTEGTVNEVVGGNHGNHGNHSRRSSGGNLPYVLQKVVDAGSSISIACKANSGTMAAIFVSCFLEFAAPGLIPYQVSKGPNHASNTFWITVFYLSGSLIGRLLTAIVSFQHFTLLNSLQCGTIIYMLCLASMDSVTVPVPISIAVIGVGSAIHGYIVTEVFQSCREAGESARASAVAGLANQIGALLGSVFVFILVQTGVIGG